MKILWSKNNRHFYSNILLLGAFALFIANTVPAQAASKNKKSKTEITDTDIHALSFDDNIEFPALGKQSTIIAPYQLSLAKKLRKRFQVVERDRNGEVIIITIQSSQLFNPNDTTLSDLGANILSQFLDVLKGNDMNNIILAMHSADVGDEVYIKKLCQARVDAVARQFDNRIDSKYIAGYSFGSSDPIATNNSIEDRKKNRRLEIYLVPNRNMIEAARKDRL